MTAALPSDALLDEMKRLHPLLIDLSLDRITDLLAKLGDPHLQLAPVIHIAGTNGKGSTAAFITAMLEAAGLRVNRYTSPHLIRFHERISLAGANGTTAPIDDETLVDVLSRVRSANGDAPMTFYEITTAAAFLTFAERPADAVVLEVGLGGRLDATNVVPHPAVTVITPVAMDHMDKLGDTLDAIAGEKAGIIKRGSSVVCAPQADDARRVIAARAASAEAPLIEWGVDFDAHIERSRLIYQEGDVLLDLPQPGLRGRYQTVNAGVAISAVRQFASRTIGEAAIANGLQNVSWPARMMPVTEGPLRSALGADDELWIDGGHNPSAGQAIAEALCDLQDQGAKPVVLIAGLMRQKDWAGYFAPFEGVVRDVITLPVQGALDQPRDPGELASALNGTGAFDARPSEDLKAALALAGALKPGAKRILICGSLYLAGAALALNEGASVRLD
ncbi:MAG: folylpolyglutamate synthase/dihydrofolate synthase family protein [Pseudomonadota bacterium]